MEQPLISGIAYNRDEAKVTIRGVPDQPGTASRIFGPISKAHLNIDMIIQNVAQDGTTDVTFTVNRDEYPEAMALLNKTAKELMPVTWLVTTPLPRLPSLESACARILAWRR
jgi:aspartate kinase